MVAVQTLSNSLYNTIGTIVIALCGSDLIRQGKMPETGINDFSTYKGRVDQYTAEVLTHYQTLKGTQGALQYVGVLLDGPRRTPRQAIRCRTNKRRRISGWSGYRSATSPSSRCCTICPSRSPMAR